MTTRTEESWARPRVAGGAVAALVVSIAGLFVCPLIGGAAALVVAHYASKQIAAGGGTRTGQEYVTVARWVGGISVAIGVVAVAVVAWVLLPVRLESGAPGMFGDRVRCSSMEWYQQAVLQAQQLLPEAGAVEVESSQCGSEGGQFVTVIDSSVGPAMVDTQFQRSAAQQGWNQSGVNPLCFEKQIAGRATFVSLAEHDMSSQRYVIKTGTSSSPISCFTTLGWPDSTSDSGFFLCSFAPVDNASEKTITCPDGREMGERGFSVVTDAAGDRYEMVRTPKRWNPLGRS